MEQNQDMEMRNWISPRPKLRQKRNEWETSLIVSQRRGQDSGLKKKTINQDNGKPRSRLGPVTMETNVMSSEMDTSQPQPRKRFSAEEASRVIKFVLERELQDSEYNATGSSQRALELAELVKVAVRDLGYERYKLVCYVVLGPVSQGAMRCCSRSLWSPSSDTYAEYLYQNLSLFAMCIVYAGYYE
ncbi:dynein light chain Tctex-type 5-B-like [Pelodytes ibericus]